MGLYDIVKNNIKKNKEVKEKGGYVGIPVPFDRLRAYIPVIERGHSIGILGATGSGKSRFTRWLFLYHVYKFYKDTGYPVRIIYFPLEDNKEKVYRNFICHYLHEVHDIYITLQELDSKGERILPEFVESKLDEMNEFFADFERTVTIVDGVHKPTDVYNYCESYAKATGKIQTYKVEIEGKLIDQARYVPDNNVHTVVIIDNLSNIDVENANQQEREAIVLFAKKYVRERLCNFFNFTVAQVMQQDFQSERQSYTRDGSTIIGKLEPSLAGIGDAKTVARSMHLVFGLFNPSRFELVQYPLPSKKDPTNTYRIDILGNRFRSLSVLKSNDTDFGMKVAFNFDAVSENMKELPKPKTPEIESIYTKIREKNPEKFAKTNNIIINQEEELEEAPF